MTTTETPVLRPLDEQARAALFTAARTASTFSANPVSDEQLTEIWELARWARRRRTPSRYVSCLSGPPKDANGCWRTSTS
jgi:hypothetical protein